MVKDHPDYARPVLGPISKDSRLEWMSRLDNNGAVALGVTATGDDRIGKYFPRGCRGQIDDIEIYCRNTGLAEYTITVYIAPVIGLGPFYTRTITVAIGAAWAWRAAAFDVFWNYDSLFIWIVCEDATLEVGYDVNPWRDWWESADVGATWTMALRRPWFRVVFQGESPGDVPVSGTVNTVRIPSVSAGMATAALPVISAEWYPVITVSGAGRIEYMIFILTHLAEYTFPAEANVEIGIEADGQVLIQALSLLTWYVDDAENTPTDITFPDIDLTEGAEQYIMHIRIPFEFRRLFRVVFRTTGGAGTGFTVRGTVFPNMSR